jgi:DNA invertase Pin-like site-specific DNA recombinase
LRAAGVATRRLYEDRASGRLDARPGLDAALKALRRGDTLIVWKLDRLGRDLRHLIMSIDAPWPVSTLKPMLRADAKAVRPSR